ncbi:hypothetical protein [Spirosoma aerophilum]
MSSLHTLLKQEQYALLNLSPKNGPTSIAFAFTNIKVLLLEISQSEADCSVYYQTWNALNTAGMNEFDYMLDHFGNGTVSNYTISFIRLKHMINEELDKLWVSLPVNN